jgi:hypothetical protein
MSWSPIRQIEDQKYMLKKEKYKCPNRGSEQFEQHRWASGTYDRALFCQPNLGVGTIRTTMSKIKRDPNPHVRSYTSIQIASIRASVVAEPEPAITLNWSH